MEKWKTRTLLNDFTRACEDDTPRTIIRSAKKLRRTLWGRTDPALAKEMVEELFPLLDDKRVYVRQCAAAILQEQKINENSFMPFRIPVIIPMEGGSMFTKTWERKIAPAIHDAEWSSFVNRYRAELNKDRDVARE